MFASRSESLRFDEAACDLKDASGEHSRFAEPPRSWFSVRRGRLSVFSTKVLTEPSVIERSGLRFTFTFLDPETVSGGQQHGLVRVRDVPPDSPIGGESELRNSLSISLGHAAAPRIMTTLSGAARMVETWLELCKTALAGVIQW